MVIDFHVHIGVSFDGAHAEENEILKLMQTNGVDKSVVFAIDDVTRGETYVQPNNRVISFMENHPERISAIGTYS